MLEVYNEALRDLLAGPQGAEAAKLDVSRRRAALRLRAMVPAAGWLLGPTGPCLKIAGQLPPYSLQLRALHWA